MIPFIDSLFFPDPHEASVDGLLAYGGALTTERLLLAYNSGIFPWYNQDEPVMWWSPDPRMVLFPDNFKVSKSLKKTVRTNKFKVTFNTAFERVITQCSTVKREGQDGTWITTEMLSAYKKLHELGHAISVEVWFEEQLVGGLYGIDLKDKKIFCGESMFALMSDASKVGFYHLVTRLKKENYQLIDCQVYTAHLESLGAEEINRFTFLSYLEG
ncbi:Leucyltransferase [unidentified eubacterium SCB49]|nr:Leucyltransferase [unidentified eubacterium SCB49]